VDVGEVDAGLLEQPALHQDARPSAAPAGTLPGVLTKALAVEVFEGGDDAVLQAAEVIDGSFAKWCGHGRSQGQDAGRSGTGGCCK
jgi:hypothetical protein